MEEEAGDAGEYFAASHVQNVTNPNLPPVVKVRGRKPGKTLSPNTLQSFREKHAATASAKKAARGQFYQELEQAQSASLLTTAAKKIMIKSKMSPRKRAEINEALTASANIEQLVASAGKNNGRDALTPTPPVLRGQNNSSARRPVRYAKAGSDDEDV
jgi:hypothetical protein